MTPTTGETFAKLLEHIRLAQEAAATLAHLARANGEASRANGWLVISENFKKIQHIVTDLATRSFQ